MSRPSPPRRSKVPIDEIAVGQDEELRDLPAQELTRREKRRGHDRTPAIRLFELLFTIPVVLYLGWSVIHEPQPFTEWQMYVWAAAVAVAELLPVPTNVSMQFSLSFPLELSAAMLFPTPAAAAIAFLGSADP